MKLIIVRYNVGVCKCGGPVDSYRYIWDFFGLLDFCYKKRLVCRNLGL